MVKKLHEEYQEMQRHRLNVHICLSVIVLFLWRSHQYCFVGLCICGLRQQSILEVLVPGASK